MIKCMSGSTYLKILNILVMENLSLPVEKKLIS